MNKYSPCILSLRSPQVHSQIFLSAIVRLYFVTRFTIFTVTAFWVPSLRLQVDCDVIIALRLVLHIALRWHYFILNIDYCMKYVPTVCRSPIFINFVTLQNCLCVSSYSEGRMLTTVMASLELSEQRTNPATFATSCYFIRFMISHFLLAFRNISQISS
jgi:hypothetical protein